MRILRYRVRVKSQGFSGFSLFFRVLYLFFHAGEPILEEIYPESSFFEQSEDDDACRDMQPVSDTDVF